MLRAVRDDAGKVLSLSAVLSERWEALEADFDRFYGRELAVEVGRRSVRWLWVRVSGMPQDAAWRDTLEWNRQDELVASLIEVTDRWMRRLAMGAGRWKPRDLPPPLNIPRPGDAPQRPKPTTDPREIAAFFNQHFKQ